MENQVIKINPIQCQCCGAIHTGIPFDHRFGGDAELEGYYWECACKSTFFIPKDSLLEIDYAS